MNQNPVSKSEFQEAKCSIRKIAPALKAIQEIDRQTVGYDDAVFSKIERFDQFLSGVHDKYQAIVDRGNQQYENRPIETINKAGVRLPEIQKLIELERKQFKQKIDTRDYKAAELRKKSFSETEIDRVISPISQTDVDESHAKIADLKAEAVVIETFLSDVPRYDTEILKGTGLYPELNEARNAA